MNERSTLLALHLSGVVGPRRLASVRKVFPELSGLFGSTEEKLGALPDWTPGCARKVLALKDPQDRIESELEKAEKHGIRVLVEGDKDFPPVFAELYDPPFVLWRVGTYEPADEKALAIVGCRKPSAYGDKIALAFAQDAARAGYTVVSGLARGIDSIAHQGALKVSTGRTLAFLGSGLLNVYPPENKKLAAQIVERGAVFSEYPLSAKPFAMHFPQRNRLISGAALGVLVVEAKKNSGTFITVDHALDQGKTVFAVPGPIQNERSEGTNALIQQGAKLVMGMEDILHEFSDMKAEAVMKKRRVSEGSGPKGALTKEEERVLEKLNSEPMHIDELGRDCGLPVPQLNAVLLSLEMKGHVQQAPGHRYFRA